MVTTTVIELVSNYVQQCLGTNLSAKAKSLDIIQDSLRSCDLLENSGLGTAKTSCHIIDDDAVVKRDDEWIAFLINGRENVDADDDDDSDLRMDDSCIQSATNYHALRASFLKCLLECCHFPEDCVVDVDTLEVDEDEENDEKFNRNAERVVELSFVCLALLASLIRRHYHQETRKETILNEKRKETPPIIFGTEFALAIAPAVVEVLRYGSNNNDGLNDNYNHGPSRAASALLIELLHPNRPKFEARSVAPILRDSILIPASSSSVSIATPISVVRVANILSSCVIAAVKHATADQEQYGGEELAVREESAVLGKLQDMRDVLLNVGLACSRQLSSLKVGREDGRSINDGCAREILNAMQGIFDIAPFAVESQLETLLDDEAKPILDRLKKGYEEHKDNNSTIKDDVMDSFSKNPTTNIDVDCNDGDDADEKIDETCDANFDEAIPSIYANIARSPIPSTTIQHLDSMLVAISERLCITNAEQWDVRLDALIDLECILAGGVTYLSEDARYIFMERIRKMPLDGQFTDLRSQITQQVCRVVIAVSYEYRDFLVVDSNLHQVVSQFIECCVPSILLLCKSGTKVMANQGVHCLQSVFAVCGFTGYARNVPRLCEVILDKKAAKNQKRGCVVALTMALRVWDPNYIIKYLEQLTLTVKEAVTNRDPTVREEGRKLYWAVVSACDETCSVVQRMFSDRSREMKSLVKERESIDAEWDDGGVLNVLAQTGVIGQAPNERVEEGIRTYRAPPKNKFASDQPGTAAARLRALHGTPFKSQKLSSPTKMANATVVDSGWKHPPTNSNGKRFLTPSTNPLPTRCMKLSERKFSSGGSIRTINAIPFDEDKENTAMMVTTSVSPKSGSPSSPLYENLASPMAGSPIMNLMTRASPLSVKKAINSGDILGEIVSMLSDRLSPHEQSLAIKALTLFAKENPYHLSWQEKFPIVLHCLLDHVQNALTLHFDEPADFIRSPSKNLSTCHQMRHLFLQGVRSLLQFVLPGYVVTKIQVKEIIDSMLECTKDAPFEIVYTAERALVNLIDCADPDLCFEYLIPHTRVCIDLSNKSNPCALLSTLRTLRHLVRRLSTISLKKELPPLLSLFRDSSCHKSMDMRKATILVLVEMQLVLGKELDLDGFSICQKRLINVYVERHPSRSQSMKD